MAEPREPSHPPSEPQPPISRSSADASHASHASHGSHGSHGSRASHASLDANADRPVRIQLFVALLLGLVLVATGLYLWRRPRAVPEASGSGDAVPMSDASTATQAMVGDAGVAAALAAQAEAGAAGGLSMGDARVVGCHDKGSKKTPAAECDHLQPIEQALAHAIEQSASCVPPAAGGGTIDYQLDVSFNRKRNPVKLSLPKGTRSMKNGKAIAACKSAVTQGLHEVAIDGVTHDHARYEISITATYPGAVKSPSK